MQCKNISPLCKNISRLCKNISYVVIEVIDSNREIDVIVKLAKRQKTLKVKKIKKFFKFFYVLGLALRIIKNVRSN